MRFCLGDCLDRILLAEHKQDELVSGFSGLVLLRLFKGMFPCTKLFPLSDTVVLWSTNLSQTSLIHTKH